MTCGPGSSFSSFFPCCFCFLVPRTTADETKSPVPIAMRFLLPLLTAAAAQASALPFIVLHGKVRFPVSSIRSDWTGYPIVTDST
jgi:hypothetical protein